MAGFSFSGLYVYMAHHLKNVLRPNLKAVFLLFGYIPRLIPRFFAFYLPPGSDPKRGRDLQAPYMVLKNPLFPCYGIAAAGSFGSGFRCRVIGSAGFYPV